MTKLLTIGTFDIPHLGHAYLLKQCEALATTVVVGVNSDRFVATYKGAPPTYTYGERAGLIAQMGYEVRHNDGPGRELIIGEHPDILAIGNDWAPDTGRDYLSQIATTSAELGQLGVVLAFLPTMPLDLLQKLSSTGIRERLSR